MVKVADFGLSRLYHGLHTMTGGLGTFQARWVGPEAGGLCTAGCVVEGMADCKCVSNTAGVERERILPVHIPCGFNACSIRAHTSCGALDALLCL